MGAIPTRGTLRMLHIGSASAFQAEGVSSILIIRSKQRKWYTKTMDLLSQLKLIKANAFVFYTKAHGYHWNVEGALFRELHAFFQEIYEGTFESLDEYAEWFRKLGVYAPFQADEELITSNVKYDFPTTSPIEMLRNLLDSNNQIILDLKNAFRIANDADEQGLANFIAERLDQHQFWKWQITASLKTTVN